VHTSTKSPTSSPNSELPPANRRSATSLAPDSQDPVWQFGNTKGVAKLPSSGSCLQPSLVEDTAEQVRSGPRQASEVPLTLIWDEKTARVYGFHCFYLDNLT
jgi:hypothetical protein